MRIFRRVAYFEFKSYDTKFTVRLNVRTPRWGNAGGIYMQKNLYYIILQTHLKLLFLLSVGVLFVDTLLLFVDMFNFTCIRVERGESSYGRFIYFKFV